MTLTSRMTCTPALRCSTMFLGIGERMTKTLTALAPSTAFEVVAPPQRKYFGEDWGTYPVFPQNLPAMWTSIGNYDESDLPRAHDAGHVRDFPRSRHLRGDPGWFVSFCLVTRKPSTSPLQSSTRYLLLCHGTTCPTASSTLLPTTQCTLPTCGEVLFRGVELNFCISFVYPSLILR